MKKQKNKEEKLGKADSGRMTIIMKIDYDGCPIYVRKVDKDLFIWDLIYKNEIYSSYIVMKPAKGKRELTLEQIKQTAKICYAGAVTTIDTLNGVKISSKDKDLVNKFEKGREKTDSLPN